ncbi:ABC transporter permease [Halorubrum sp. Atlit-8R]|uniref:ABC transporter permease n=1 Tax=unclassified Halorubrum TaxID=2642239 RepID=UPI000EF1C5A1|nr:MULTISPECIES: ABC transporter permease [unclassified Halorubrum]RLM71592.1 ABC transporter permease [Halorubrum sp. Atlit-9R]RLM82254.1 ABC transporter permease [Halorubrum sp. Atlit-8R]
MSKRHPLRRFPSALMAWRNLGRNRVRTALATLGILIGVVSIASLGMATAAIQQQATANLEGLSNEVIISAGPDNPTDGISADQVDDIERLAGDATVVPERSNVTTLSARNGAETRISVTALTKADALYNVSQGRISNRLQSGALLSQAEASRLGIEVGDPITYDGQLYRVQGILSSSQGLGGQARVLVLPLSAMDEQNYYDSVTVLITPDQSVEPLTADIRSSFNTADEEVVRVRNFASVQQNVGSFLRTLRLGLLGIGSISLVVASVAILNVMLMSTVERRGEIGVLRAVGITRGEILRMILTEAVFLGAIGGVLGVVVSVGVGVVLFEFLVGSPLSAFRWQSAQYLLYGMVFAVTASALSGVYPAWKAANERPVEALRD